MTAEATEWGLVTDIGDLDGKDTATFSEDRAYRYQLARMWSDGGRVAVWVMLNPSTADAFVLDPTLRRCKGFAQAWGCDGMVIVNLFALRATNPKVMLSHPNPVGLHNDWTITATLMAYPGATWVAGWGPTGRHLDRGQAVASLLQRAGVQLHAVKVTKDGHPGHPLYVRGDAALVPWPVGRRVGDAA